MTSRQISLKTIAPIVVALVAIAAGLYLFKLQPSSKTDTTAGSDSKTLVPPELWRDTQLQTPLAQASGRSEWVSSLAISTDGKTLISGSDDKTIKIWNLETGKLQNTLSGHNAAVNSVAISPDGKQIVSGSDDKTIKLWDLSSGKELHSFADNSGEIKFVDFSADGKTLISVSDEKKSDKDDKTNKTIKIWDVNSFKKLETFTGGTGTVNAVAFNPKTQILAIGSNNANTIDLWYLANKKLVNTVTTQSPKVVAVALSPDGTILAGSGNYGVVELWKLDLEKLKLPIASLDPQQRKSLSGNSGTVEAIAFSPDGKTLFTGSRDLTVKTWNVNNGELVRILKNSAWVEAVNITPDGKTLITATALGEINLWRPSSQGYALRKEVAENVSKLLSTRSCKECDLSGVDLSNLSLNDVDLRWANLSGANLNNTNLSGANLENSILFAANLERTNLTKAKIEGANLAKAKLTATIMPDGKVSQDKTKQENSASAEAVKQ
ncbi:hypothetical protein NIES592_13810 [Fischerella major NIES-592]|uniref:Uncharacterized protein n=1 Tax=Fischerella major NIES-592 TaxID=210994 RepID=A0A1U7GZ18_9CYAN|nr:pentapeptide repeat-containing protein [Fischerella major]OKH13677.1 hypothetical protein NIES592_13810 [Fischerella major NIES-592]